MRFRDRQCDREGADDVAGSGLFERIDRCWHVRDSAGLAGDADPGHLGTPARAGNARRTDHSDPNTRKAGKKSCQTPKESCQNLKKVARTSVTRPKNSLFGLNKLLKLAKINGQNPSNKG